MRRVHEDVDPAAFGARDNLIGEEFGVHVDARGGRIAHKE